MSQQEKQAFQKKIFRWWEKNRRDLPWRHTNDPYKILVSEVMLQQTTVSRVLTKYPGFIKRYPTLKDLAVSRPADVLRIWKGMGYNRRALHLHQTAKVIVQKYGEFFPKDEQELVKLPGLGRYTARAVLVFAFNKNVAMVDTNIRQIITHFFFHDTPQPEKNIQELADQLVPKGMSWEWHQALMDFGSHMRTVSSIKYQVSSKKKKPPFKQSNRYFRGRIIDLLRDRSYKENELIKNLCSMYGKDETFYISLLKALEKEGLVAYKKSTWKLPG